MHILLTNYILGGTTGSETWVATVDAELQRRGHTTELSKNPETLPDHFDLAIINHNVCLEKAQHLTCKKIFTSHGILPSLEQPVKGADVYVAVSEEVQANLRRKGFTSTVIRNGLDLEKFKPTEPVNEKLKNVLFSSNYHSNAENIIRQACNLLEVNFTRIGGNNRVTNVPEILNQHDLVIGLGRTAYEAMACNRNVIIYDYKGGDGFVTPQTVVKYRRHNCSGRYNHLGYTPHQLAEQMKRYNPNLTLRNYTLLNHDIEDTVSEYLEL